MSCHVIITMLYLLRTRNSLLSLFPFVHYVFSRSPVQTVSPTGDPRYGLGPAPPALPEDLKHSLECPVCSRIALPPVMQCRNGHVTCNSCRLKLQNCPMCREVDIDIRNMFAEKAVTYMTIPCEFGQFGCRVEVPYREKEGVSAQASYATTYARNISKTCVLLFYVMTRMIFV